MHNGLLHEQYTTCSHYFLFLGLEGPFEFVVDKTPEGSIHSMAHSAGPIIIDDDQDDDLHDRDILVRNKEEWMQLATVVDHLLFVSGFFGITSLTVIYFLIVKVLAVSYDEIFSSLTSWAQNVAE